MRQNLVKKCQCVFYQNYKILHMLTFANIMVQFLHEINQRKSRICSIVTQPAQAKILLHLLELNCTQC